MFITFPPDRNHAKHPLKLVLGFLGLSVLATCLTWSTPVFAQFSGLDHERDLNYAEAIVQYRLEIEQQEALTNDFDLSLYPKLMGLARSLRSVGELEAAIDAAQRAQHITHRHHGVHNPMQIEVLELKTQIHLRQSEPLLADKQQRFAFYIRQSNVEPESIELLPALEELSRWYENTGQLHRARKLHEKSIEIVESHFGPDASEQLPYLQKLAKLKRLQRVCCSTRIMKQALEVVDANPNIDDQLKADIYIEIADAYTISGDRSEAKTFYQKAWELMPPEAQQATFSEPSKIALSRPLNSHTSANTRIFRADNRNAFGRREFRPLLQDEIRELDSLPPQEFVLNTDSNDYDVRIRDRNLASTQDQEPAVRTVGQPYAFLHQQFLQILPARMKSDAALASIQVELIFDIDSAGKPHNIQVASKTDGLPNKVSNLMREVVRKSRFRPRMEDGFPVATSQFRITQSFAAKAAYSSENI